MYSEVIALADVLKDATFSELDFTELEHDYNKTQIKYSWNDAGTGITYLNPSTSGFRDAYSTLKYPFIDWGHQYLIGGSTTTIATSGNPELTTLEQAFRPCIQLKYLINRIFAASGFNYTSDFFDSADFEKLYMDFNWGSGNSPVHFTTSGASITQSGDAFNYAPSGSWAVILFLNDLPSFTWSTESGYDQATGIFTVTSDVTTYNIGCHIWVTFFTYSTIWVEWVSVDAVTGIVTIHSSASYTHTSANSSIHMFAMPIIVTLNTGDTLYPRFQSDLNLLNKIYTGNTMWATISSATFTTATLLQTLRGELGQWDFLKGIMTMFNLVSMVDENDPNNILIEPYSDIFITNPNSERLDWTEKIDASEMELKPLTDLNKNTIFQFVEDDDDYCFNIYKNSTGRLYGSKVFPPVGSAAAGFSILQGTKEIVAEPFAATVSKPLMPQFSEFIIPSLYAMSDDGTTEGFDNSPRIFYNNGEKGTGASYFIPTQNGVTGENQEDFLQFSHLTDIPTIAGSTDFVFESQQLFPGVGNAPTDNLFSMYWQPYFNELYNADTRTMTLKVNLSPSDVAAFKFYDTVFIKNRVFRVNKIEYKPNDLATVEFILIP